MRRGTSSGSGKSRRSSDTSDDSSGSTTTVTPDPGLTIGLRQLRRERTGMTMAPATATGTRMPLCPPLLSATTAGGKESPGRLSLVVFGLLFFLVESCDDSNY